MIEPDFTGKKISNYVCKDYKEITTPIKVNWLWDLLVQSNYDKTKTKILIEGFTEGFDLGYRGPVKRTDTADNLPIKSPDDLFDIWGKLVKEVKLSRIAGPFTNIPTKHYMQSPIGLVPKAGNKTRLIFHLSYDFECHKSVNFYTPRDLCSEKYRDLDHAISTCLWLRKMCADDQFEGVAFGKTDIISAFCIVLTRPAQHFFISYDGEASKSLGKNCTSSINGSHLGHQEVVRYSNHSQMH